MGVGVSSCFNKAPVAVPVFAFRIPSFNTAIFLTGAFLAAAVSFGAGALRGAVPRAVAGLGLARAFLVILGVWPTARKGVAMTGDRLA